MRDEKHIQSGDSVFKSEGSAAEGLLLQTTVEHLEKGSFRSMWELLMQLRVLLPYLTRLVPLLDRGLVKAAPDLTELHKSLETVHMGSRELGVQVRNQALQLERIEEQMLRLREISERNQTEARELSRGLRSLTGWIRALTILTVLIFVALIVLGALFLSHAGH